MKTLRMLVVFVCSLLFVCDVSAQFRRSRRQIMPSVTYQGFETADCQKCVEIPAKKTESKIVSDSPKENKSELQECADALAEVNEARAKRGLKPYINDPVLNKAALACARYRAERLMDGHCNTPRGDFSFLPQDYDTNGVVGGCAAWRDGFGACALYDNYTFCGAAWVRGKDGLKYCHIFCR